MSFKKLLSLFLLGFVLITSNGVIAAEEEAEEIDFTSAVITALSCAQEVKETGEFEVLSSCPPHALFEGVSPDKIYTAEPKVVIFDVTEGEFYYVQPSKESVTYAQLLEGFGGSLDGSGVIIGEKEGIPVVKLEEATVTPKPKPGFFKGCL